MHLIFLAEIIAVPVKQHGGPVVIVSGDRFPERDRHLFKSKTVRKLSCHILIAFPVHFACSYIRIRCMDSKYICRIFFVCDADVHIFTKLTHHLACLFLAPKLIPVIQVTGDLYPCLLCRLACIQADCCHIVIQRRSNAGKMEPLSAFKNLFPLEVLPCRCENGRTCPVVNDLGRSLGCALFQKINPHTVTAPRNMGRVHSKFTQ